MRALFLAMAFSTLGLSAPNVHDFTLRSIDGQDVPLSAYKGKVLLIVNVASNCGFTGQYAGLQSLYQKYADRGLVVIGVPANNFGGQEPGTDQEIKTFCTRNYKVTFPMMSKISVKGDDKAPLYRYLTDKTLNPDTGGEVRWNFTKFLVGRGGRVLERFESMTSPESSAMIKALEKALAQ